ncbi:MAG: cytochrome C biosynthesis protein [Armatimonadetes bacterium]|nr:cytochrome C biosynthesis protein [Armatimonadota bacterium]
MRDRWVVLSLAVAAVLALAIAAPVGVRILRWRELGRVLHAPRVKPSRPPRISPDYTGLVIPPNIAPLNFAVLERGSRYCVNLRWMPRPSAGFIDVAGRAEIGIMSDSPAVRFPLRRWRALLREAQLYPSPMLTIDVAVRDDEGKWHRYAPIDLEVAEEPIDPYLVNRIIRPLYNYWTNIEIRQRCLESFEERTVVHNRATANACLNCHSFRQNHTDRMTLGVRSGRVGSATVMVRDGRAEKIGTKFGYTAWHPSGLVAAYSVNEVRQFFHTAGGEVRDVVDLDSGLAYYDLRTQTAKTAPAINAEDRLETYPTWSPDGKWLYFCSAAFPWQNRHKLPPDNYDRCRYDLRRVSYDVASDRWGEAETVPSSAELGKSLLLPRISPDGRFLLFCACDYGCFPIYQPNSDLYMLDLKTGRYSRLDISSPRSESWHSWSSNSCWIAFSSKRRDGLFTRTYLAYVDPSGRVHKPFVVPQEDPTFYDSCLDTYTVPELIAEPVPVRSQRLVNVIASPQEVKVESPVTFGAPPTSGATASDSPWMPGRR